MSKFRQSDMLVAGVMMMILTVLIIPIPTGILDFMLVFSIAMGMLVLFIALQLYDPLQLSSFPSLLLILTLFRLSLNVATTRQILLNGYAGKVVQAFGDFVVGGNYVVGVVIFLILVLINFMVITKGSGRIAEVAARFTLDAMPGKQMSIDADLNAGLIDEAAALRRREELSNEAEFYGAMDGASKFVRGDAVAGLVITAINIAGGFAIGMLQLKMEAGDALRTYTILTVGDGLISQIPALVISTAAGMLVTRAASEESVGEDLKKQLFCKPKPLMTTGVMLGAMAFVPGLPFVPFLVLGALMGGLGYSVRHLPGADDKDSEALGAEDAAKALPGQAVKGLPAGGAAEIPDVSAMEVEIGFGLVSLVDRAQGGTLLDRISTIRQQMADELGFTLPPVNVHDNANLRNAEYTIKIRGLEVARGSLQPSNFLAVDPSGNAKFEGGMAAKDPTFGFPAWWVTPSQRELAEARGLTVVDAGGVLSTHIAETVRRYAADLLKRQDVSDMIDHVKKRHASVVQELIPGRLSIGVVHRVLQLLLRERVSIRDLPSVLELLADHAGKTQDPEILSEVCRRGMGGHLVAPYLENGTRLPAIALHPEMESILRDSIQRESGELGVMALAPEQAGAILDSISSLIGAARKKGRYPVLVALPLLRRHLRRMVESSERDLAVLSFGEIPDNIDIDIIGLVKGTVQPRKPVK